MADIDEKENSLCRNIFGYIIGAILSPLLWPLHKLFTKKKHNCPACSNDLKGWEGTASEPEMIIRTGSYKS